MASNFRTIREEIGITQQVMAMRAGVSMVTIHKLEAGDLGTQLHLRVRQGIARAYGVDPVTGEPTDENRSTSPATAAKQIPADSNASAA